MTNPDVPIEELALLDGVDERAEALARFASSAGSVRRFLPARAF